MRYKKNIKYNLELLIYPIILGIATLVFIVLFFSENHEERGVFFVIGTEIFVFGIGFIFFLAYFFIDLKKQRLTLYGKLCADVPRCFNISLGNKEIAKRIMLDAHKNYKRKIEKHFDEWVISCVRDKFI